MGIQDTEKVVKSTIPRSKKKGNGENGDAVLVVKRVSTEIFLKFLRCCGHRDSFIEAVREKENEF